MNYQITSDNIDLTSSMIALAQEKFSKVEHRFSQNELENTLVRIVLNTAPVEEFVVKIELNANGKQYFTERTGFSLENALIEAVKEIVVKGNMNL